MTPPSAIGVVGAGTMGAGIAQLGCAAGFETRLHDPVADALARGETAVANGLAKMAAKGRLDGEPGALVACSDLAGLAGCELVIEAAPERPDLKRELFRELSEACGAGTVLATNTSSIPVTSLAPAAAEPENVVGMHFFNPPPLMRLVELIRADQTGDAALERAREVAVAMGRTPIVAADGPGFIVNRCGRPFYTEALRLLTERVATHEQIDRIYRLGLGFRMGPFELMDLVGIDVGFEVAKSFMELSFGEPRWKPSPIQARMVAAGRLGRKSGRGYYDYSLEPYRPPDPEPPAGGEDFAALAAEAGFGDYVLLPGSGLVECFGDPDPAVEALAARAGLHHAWVKRAPGGVQGRVIACLVNEALFALGEGAGSREDIDLGLELGLNHPRGPLAWGDLVGLDRVRSLLDEIWQDRREERYRPAPELVAATRPG